MIENLPNKEIQRTSEWKALKISIYRNLSQYYSNSGDIEGALNTLTHVVPLQKELEDVNVILPGGEFIYVSMAELSFKLKSYVDSAKYAGLASRLLERQLNLVDGYLVTMKLQELKKARASEDPKAHMARSRKFIALSYCFYLAGKSLMKSKNLGSIEQAALLLEKAYTISNQVMGAEDKVTKSYKKKYESALEMVDQAQIASLKTPDKVEHRSNPVPQQKLHSKTKSLAITPRDHEPELQSKYQFLMAGNYVPAEGKRPATAKGAQTSRNTKIVFKKAKSPSAQFILPKSPSTLGSLGITAPKKNFDRNASRSLVPSDFVYPGKAEYAIENNDLMIFDTLESSGLKKQTFYGNLRTRDFASKASQSTLHRSGSTQQIFRSPDNFSKMLATESTTLREPLTTSSSIHTFQGQPNQSKKPSFGSLTRPTTAHNHKTSSPDALSYATYGLDPAASLRSPQYSAQRVTTEPQGNMNFGSSAIKQVLSREGVNTALNFLTSRPQTSNKTSDAPKMSSQLLALVGKTARPMTAAPKTERLSTFGEYEFIQDFTQKPTITFGDHKRPTSALPQFGNQLHVGKDQRREPGSRQSEGIEGSELEDISIASIKHSRHTAQEEGRPQLIIGGLTERPYQRPPVDIELSNSKTDDIEEIVELEKQLEEGMRFGHPYGDGKVGNVPTLPKDYLKNIQQHPRRNLSKELITYIKATGKEDISPLDPNQQRRKSTLPIPDSSPRDLRIAHFPDSFPDNELKTPLLVDRSATSRLSIPRMIHEKSSQPKPKVIKDITEFRKMEDEAARKIQKFFRQRRTRRKPLSEIGDGESINISRHGTVGVAGFLKEMMDNARGTNDFLTVPGVQNRATGVTHLLAFNSDKEREDSPQKKVLTIPTGEVEERKYSQSFQVETRKDNSFEVSISDLSAFSCKGFKTELPKSSQQLQQSSLSPRTLFGENVTKISISPARSSVLLTNTMKNEAIKSNVDALHAVEIVFRKQIQGFVSYWTLKLKGIREVDGELWIETLLTNERIVYHVESKIDFKTAERLMFQYSVWPLVAESKGMQGGEEQIETLTRRKSLIGRKDELFDNPVTIRGFKSKKEKKLISEEEQFSIRKLLSKLTKLMKVRTTRYHKKNGYVFHNTKADPEADIVRKNREELMSYKRRYAEAVHRLSTYLPTHSIVHELQGRSQSRERAWTNESLLRNELKRRDIGGYKIAGGYSDTHGSIGFEEDHSSGSIRIPQHPSKGSNSTIEEDEVKFDPSSSRRSLNGPPPQKSQTILKRREKRTLSIVEKRGLPVPQMTHKLRSVNPSKPSLDESMREKPSKHFHEKTHGSFIGLLTKELEYYKNPFLKK